MFRNVSTDTRHHFVQTHDRFVEQTLKDYIKENKLDAKSVVVSLTIKTSSYDTVLYLNQIKYRGFDRFPSCYTFVDDFLIFIYSDADAFIQNESRKSEILSIMNSYKISLDPRHAHQ